jgi:hypothetical protein
MLRFSGQTTQGDRINFRSNDIRHIVKDEDVVVLDRPDKVIVKFSSLKVEKYDKVIRGSDFPLVVRLGFH